MRLGDVHRGLIALLIAMVLIAPTVLAGTTGTIDILIDKARDGVRIDGIAEATFDVEKTGSYLKLSSTLNTRYYPSKNVSTLSLVVKMEGKPKEEVKINVSKVELKSTFVSGKGRSEIKLSGVVGVEKGDVELNVYASSASKDKVDISKFDIKVRIPLAIVPKDFLTQLPMLKQMFTPEMLNMQLAMANITGITFKEFVFDYTLEKDMLSIVAKGVVEVSYEEYMKSYRALLEKMMKPEEIEKLMKIFTELQKISKNVQSEASMIFKMVVDKKYVSMYLDIESKMKGPIEDYMRALVEYFLSSYSMMFFTVPKAPPEFIEAFQKLKPVLSLIILPDNTSVVVYVDVDGVKGVGRVEVGIKNLRIGHVELRGDEATKEVASTLLSLLNVVKKYVKPYGVDVKVKCNVPAETKPEVVSAIESFIKSYGAKISERMGIVIVKPSPTPTATPTKTITTPPPPPPTTPSPTVTKTVTTITITIPVSMPKPTKVYIVEVPPISITPPTTTVTVLKTISKILTETVEKTVVATKTVTTTYSTTLTTTKITTTTVTTTPSTYVMGTIGLVVLAVIILAVAALLRRR